MEVAIFVYALMAAFFFVAGTVMFFMDLADGADDSARMSAQIALGGLVWPLTVLGMLLYFAFKKT